MAAVDDVDANISLILRTYRVITVVGASANPVKAANYVPEHMRVHGWRIIPVNPARLEIFSTHAVATLAEVEEPVEFVDVFRPSAQTPDIVREAVDVGATAVWLQLGIFSAESREIAASAGLIYVEDRCLLQEQRRWGFEAPLS